MNSRERFIKTLNHQQPDKVPLDLGATGQTGISASTLYKLRKALNLPQKSITVIEPMQILGKVDKDIMDTLGVDIVGLWNPQNMLGIKNEKWKPWTMGDGTPTLMAGDFNYEVKPNGETYVYPCGDRSAPASVKLPKNGFFFDNIDRGGEVDEDNLDPGSDYKDSFNVFDDETAMYFEKESKRLYEETEYGIIGNIGGGGFGDVAELPGPSLKYPKGIRKMEDWLIAHIIHEDYIIAVFEMQAKVAIKNLQIYKEAVGDRVQAVWISGTDFGTQNSEMTSPELYRRLYKPFHKKINDWVHNNTNWKTFYHSCGSIVNLLDDMVEAGVDIINPVQCSAKGMDPKMLKDKYGEKLVFWGGGIDTQKTLPFGTREEVRKEALERLEIFSKNGGYVFNTVHNIVGNTPIDNLTELYRTVKDFNEG